MSKIGEKMEAEVFIVGKVRLNGNRAPLIEVVLDTKHGRTEGEIILLKEVAEETREYYCNKIDRETETKIRNGFAVSKKKS